MTLPHWSTRIEAEEGIVKIGGLSESMLVRRIKRELLRTSRQHAVRDPTLLVRLADADFERLQPVLGSIRVRWAQAVVKSLEEENVFVGVVRIVVDQTIAGDAEPVVVLTGYHRNSIPTALGGPMALVCPPVSGATPQDTPVVDRPASKTRLQCATARLREPNPTLDLPIGWDRAFFEREQPEPLIARLSKIPALHSATVRLCLREAGSQRTIRIPADGLTLGRAVPIPGRLDDRKIGRRHCSLKGVRGALLCTDLSSTNGTWVDGVRITASVLITAGRTLRVGTTVFIVESL